jgi:hypothetical protein
MKKASERYLHTTETTKGIDIIVEVVVTVTRLMRLSAPYITT